MEDLPDERWAAVSFALDTKNIDYYVSDQGRLKAFDRRTKKERLLKGSRGRGYKKLNVRLKDGQRISCYVHKLIAEYFVEKTAEDQIYVIHLDHVKKNNLAKNLKWVNHKDRYRHQQQNPRFQEAMKNNRRNYKLSEEEVADIKRLLKEAKIKPKNIAQQFGISEMQVSRIKRGENWAHIKAAKGK